MAARAAAAPRRHASAARPPQGGRRGAAARARPPPPQARARARARAASAGGDDGRSSALRAFATGLLREHWRRAAAGWACTALAIGALLRAVPLLGEAAEAAGAGDVRAAAAAGGALLGYVLARAAATAAQDTLLWDASLRHAAARRAAALRAVLGLDALQVASLRAGDVTYRVSAGAERAAEAAYALTQRLAPSLAQLVAVLAQMVSLSGALTVVVLALAPAMAAVVGRMGAGVQRRSADAQRLAGAAAARAAEALPAHALLKAYGAEGAAADAFEADARAHAAARLGAERSRAIATGAIAGVYAATVLALLLAGAAAVRASALGAGGLVSFVTCLALLIEPIQNAGSAFNELKQAEPAIARLEELAALEPAVKDGAAAHGDRSDADSDVLRLEGVWFDYAAAPRMPDIGGDGGQGDQGANAAGPGDDGAREPALRGLSLCVRRGEAVALVGPSGSGKSTVALLAARLADAQAGEVLLCGRDVKGMKLEDVHDLVALAPQQAQLLSGSVLDNIALGRSHTATSDAAGARARAQKALERADADEFVRAMGGLDAPVGESGSALSGGQRARVGVARALYRTLGRGDGQGGAPADAGDDNTARLVVLDEPTAALDGASQSRLIKETVRTCKESGTAILLVAHRLEAAMCCDRVLYLEGGQVVESGTPTELARAKDGRFSAALRSADALGTAL